MSFVIRNENNPTSDNDDQNDQTESLPDDEPESQAKNGVKISIASPPANSNFLPIAPAPAPSQLFGNPNPKLPLTSSSLPVPVMQASLPSQTPQTFTPSFGYPQQQIIRPFSQPQQQNHYVQVPMGALVSVGTLVSTPNGQTTLIPQPIQPIGAQTSGQMMYTQPTMTPNIQMSSVVSSSPSIRALTQTESEKLQGKIVRNEVKTTVIQSSTPAKQLSNAIKEPSSIEPSSGEMTISIAEKSLEEKTTFQQNIEPNTTEPALESTQFEVTEILSQANSEVSSQPTQTSTANKSVLESIESIEIPDSPPQQDIAAEPVIERHPSTDQSQTGQMEIEGLDLNLAGNEEESTQIDDAIPVSDSDEETSTSCEPLNNSASSSNVTSGLKLEPIELGETPLAIVPIIESQSGLALEPPSQQNHQVVAPLPKKTPRTNRHTIVEPSKAGFFYF